MRPIIQVVVVLSCILLTGISFGDVYGGGSGTDTDPYQIWTAEQMNEIGINQNYQ